MHSFEIKQKYINFLKSKGHKECPNESLIPQNDPTTLFISAGMHPLVPYLLGEKHVLGKRLTNIQRCFRTVDIDVIGDTFHHTLFEMLGYWSLGDYFKDFALRMSFEFYTSLNLMNFDAERIYVTVFEGDKDAEKDNEAITIWKDIFQKKGIEAEVYDGKDLTNPHLRIFPLNKKENWWGPAGETGPCGPCSEIFYWRGKGKPNFKKFVPWDDSNMFIEIGNDVFMAFNRNKDGSYTPLKQKNVDFGAGFERITLISQFRKKDGSVPLEVSAYDTDLFDTPYAYLRSLIEDESKQSVIDENNPKNKPIEFDYTLTDLSDIDRAVRSFRVILDHIRSCTFLLGDGVQPSNKDQGYILRRLIRRSIRHAKLLKIQQNFTKDMAKLYIEKYKIQYPFLETNEQKIIDTLEKEEINFEKTLERGSKEVDKLTSKGKKISGKDLFFIYETYGFPLENALDHLGIFDEEKRNNFEKEFNEVQKVHQKKSREGASQKFKSGLADTSVISTRYHTATHLLLRSLQLVLGDHVHQRGSNITAERLRFDFSHPNKLSPDEIKKVEDLVNEKIQNELVVESQIMDKNEALKISAEHEFNKTYPDKVTVYFLKDKKTGEIFSKEFCGGPHVKNLGELAESGKFKILKEESSGAGIRRIKAVLR